MLIHAVGLCHAEGWQENETAVKTRKGFQDRRSRLWRFSEANRGRIPSEAEGLAAESDRAFLKLPRGACRAKPAAQRGTKLPQEGSWS